MESRRPLPDLCIIAVFKMLTPNDQLKAAEMSVRCAGLVRAANSRMQTLVITDWSDLGRTNEKINVFSLGAKPSMRLVKSWDSSSDYPLTNSVHKWNCLLLNRHVLQLDSPDTIAKIVRLFPAITDLKFIACNSNQCERLVDLLLNEHSSWPGQLTSLMVTNFYSDTADLAHSLIGTINNRLQVLRHLAIHWDSNVELPELVVLARLKVLSIRLWPRHIVSFLRSLEHFGSSEVNNNLSVHLLPFSGGTDGSDTAALQSLGDPHCGKIVRYGWDPLHYTVDNVPFLCERFHSLASLSVRRITPTQVGPLFIALSPLAQLVHLQLVVNFEKIEWVHQPEEELPAPLAQSHSARALDLELIITSHSQVQWLNLQWTLPYLQAIHLKDFHCRDCNVNLRDYLRGRYLKEGSLVPSFSTVRKCLQTTITSLHSGVHHRRIILGFAAQNGMYCSLEQLFLGNQ